MVFVLGVHHDSIAILTLRDGRDHFTDGWTADRELFFDGTVGSAKNGFEPDTFPQGIAPRCK